MISEFQKYTKLDSSFTQNQGKLGSATRYERDLFKKAVDFFTNETSSLFILFLFLDIVLPVSYAVNYSIAPIVALGGLLLAGQVASSVANAGVNMATSSLDYARQQELQEDSQEFNAAQAELNRDWQEKMYNQYYSPGATVRQYQEAGINPVLASGISPGTPPSGSSASSGISSAPHTSPGTPMDIVNGVYNLLNAKEDINVKKAQADLLSAQAAGQLIDNSVKEFLNQANLDLIKNQSSKIITEIDNIKKDTENKAEQKGLIALQKTLAGQDSALKNYEEFFQLWRKEYRDITGSDPTLSFESQLFNGVVNTLIDVTNSVTDRFK